MIPILRKIIYLFFFITIIFDYQSIIIATRSQQIHSNTDNVSHEGNKTVAIPHDNPTSIIPPYDGPDPGYIIAESGK